MSAVVNVLFLCTGNTARSILGERLLAHHGAGRFAAFSAGSRPKGSIHPLTLRTLAVRGIAAGEARSKSWDEFAAPGAPVMDIVLTACDAAAGEACPLWPGAPVRAHWGVPDPAAAEGSEAERLAAFAAACDALERRVRALVALDPSAMDAASLRRDLAAIGRL